MASMNSPNSSIPVRTGRQKTTIKRSADDENYIEHLEDELSAARNQPTISQQHIFRMNQIAQENRQLQLQLRDWESRYDDQVRDYFQQHTVAERSLRNQNESLEDYAIKAKDRVVELEAQLSNIKQALEAAESANVQLEKRVEIMSDLLTSSPAKIELHSETPRRRMQMRPRSMLPRMQTNIPSWIGSPERGPEPLPSPAMSVIHLRDSMVEFEPLEPIKSVDISSPVTDETSEISTYDERPSTGRSSSFVEHLASLAAQSNDRTRPMRRMRRFGAGSNGPKPLILPHTSHSEFNPTSAPPLERHEFPSLDYPQSATEEWSRSRAFSKTYETPQAGEGAPDSFDQMLEIAQRSATRSESTQMTSIQRRRASRSLLDELNAAKDDNKKTSDDEESLEDFETIGLDTLSSRFRTNLSTPQKQETVELDILTLHQDDPFRPGLESVLGPFGISTPASDPTPLPRKEWDTPSSNHSFDEQTALSTLDKLRKMFGDLLRSPTDFARMLVHLTQHRMHVPSPLISVQWWLVGLLWNPMARSHVLHLPAETPTRPDIGSRTPSLALDQTVAYGTLSSSPLPRRGLGRDKVISGPGRKRVGSVKPKKQESLFSKHHPLLWAKFSLTLAFAVGTAFASGPGSLMSGQNCPCKTCQRKYR